MRVDSFSHHLLHPFSSENNSLKLSACEKIASLSGLILVPLGIIPGIVAFYTIAYLLKEERLKQNASAVKTADSAKKRFDDSLPASDVSKSCSPLNATQDRLAIKQSLSQIPIQGLKAIYESQKDQFELILAKAIAVHDETYIKACLNCLNKKDLTEFLRKEKLLNFKLNFPNQSNQLGTNSTILAATIPYFRVMFESGMKEAACTELEVGQIDSKLFSELLDFAFFGELHISESNYFRLYEMAGFYGLDELQKHCYIWMSKNISETSFQGILELACNHHLDELKKLCEIWISEHATDFDVHDLKSLKNHYQLNLVTVQSKVQDQLLSYFAMNRDPSMDAQLVLLLQSLESLDLRCFAELSTAQIGVLISLCPNVKRLISDREGILIAKSLPNLESLSLEGNYGEPDLAELAELNQLQDLRLHNVKKEHIKSLPTLGNLKSLALINEFSDHN